jgi:hypothetical protein
VTPHQAVRCDTRVLFVASWMNERSEVVMRVAPAGGDTQTIIEDFLAFVDAMPAPAPASRP